MSKVIIKYHSGLDFSDGETCLLEFDWDKLHGAYEYGIKNSSSNQHIVDHLVKYHKLTIPAIYHSKNRISQIFILDMKEVERYLKLKQLDI
jgi:hypothetical protein